MVAFEFVEETTIDEWGLDIGGNQPSHKQFRAVGQLPDPSATRVRCRAARPEVSVFLESGPQPAIAASTGLSLADMKSPLPEGCGFPTDCRC